MKNVLKGVQAFMLTLLVFVLFTYNVNAAILKTDIPDADVPIVANIELSQTKFLQPMNVDVKIVLSPNEKTANADIPLYLYSPNGDIIRDIGNNGEIYIEPGKEIIWNGNINITYKDLNAGLMNFIIKYPVVLKNKKIVYKNYDMPVLIKKLNKNLIMLSMNYFYNVKK